MMPVGPGSAASFERELMGGYDELVAEFQGMKLRTLNLGKRVAESLTPVRTGKLKSSWGISQGTLDFSQAGGFSGGVAGSPRVKTGGPARHSLRGAGGRFREAQAFESAYLFNSTDYGVFVEHGTPYMAARPMLAPAVRAMESVRVET